MQRWVLYVQTLDMGRALCFPRTQFSEEPKEPSFPPELGLHSFISFEHLSHFTFLAQEPHCSLPLGA